MSALGIIGAAVAGGLGGAGSGMAQAGKMDYEAELQRQRDEALGKRAERLQALQQQFTAAESEKQRGFLGTEGALTRGSHESIADKTAAVTLAGQAQHAQSTKDIIAGHEKVAGMTIASHERIAHDAAKNLQIGEDGALNAVTSDGKGNFISKPVLNEDGEPLVVGKNLNQMDAKKIDVIQKQIATAEAQLTKLSDPQKAIYEGIAKDTNDVAALRRRYQTIMDSGYGELNDILGTSLGGKATAPAANRKPLSSFLK